MTLNRLARAATIGSLVLSLSACGGGLASGDSGLFRGNRNAPDGSGAPRVRSDPQDYVDAGRGQKAPRTTLRDLFNNNADPNVTVEVNKYIWNASLDVLNFLPIESVDPFTGVIVTGYGVPPGGGRAYRATIYVQDPALDARSLKVALQSRGGGPVAADTARAVEDAILTRARQLRVQDSRL